MILIYSVLLSITMGQPLEHDSSTVMPLQETGLFFERLPDIRTYQTQWRLVTSLDVSKYLSNAPPVQPLLSIISRLCKKHESANCLSKDLGPRLIRKEENAGYYRTLIRSTMGDHPYLRANNPRRSAPFGFMGTVSSVLFGTLTEEDADYYNKELNKIDKNEHEITEIVARQTHIIKGEFSSVHSRLLNLTSGMSRLTQMVKEHSEQLQKTQSEIDKLRFERGIKEMLFETEKALDDYSTNLLLLIDAILLAKQGILHPAVFSPQQLLISAQQIKQSSSREFPFSPEELLTEQLERITKLNIVFTKGRIVFELTVPLLDHQVFHLYEVHPCPSTQLLGSKQVLSYIQPKQAYIAVSSDEQYYLLPTEEYLRSCRLHHKQLLGPATLPLFEANQHATCETTLLLNPTAIDWNTCNIKVSPHLQPHWENLNAPATWLYFMPEEKRAQIYCKGKKATMQTFRGTGILKLGAGCQTTINSMQLGALDVIETAEDIIYYPAVSYNLSILLPEIKEHHIKAIDINPQKEDHTKNNWANLPTAISLDAIEQQLKGITTHRELIRNQRISTFSITGIVTAILIALCLLGLKFWFFQKHIKQEQNNPQTPETNTIETVPPPAPTTENSVKPCASIF